MQRSGTRCTARVTTGHYRVDREHYEDTKNRPLFKARRRLPHAGPPWIITSCDQFQLPDLEGRQAFSRLGATSSLTDAIDNTVPLTVFHLVAVQSSQLPVKCRRQSIDVVIIVLQVVSHLPVTHMLSKC